MSPYFQKIIENPITPRKIRARDFMLSFFPFTKVKGLAGPLIQNYIEYMRSKGFKLIHSYENDINTLYAQKNIWNSNKSLRRNVVIIPGDYSQVDYYPDFFYDCDFCCGPKRVANIIEKIPNNFLYCFSTRKNNVLDAFFNIRKESYKLIGEYTTPINYKIYQTSKGTYYTTSYKDSSAMILIAKIK